MWTVLGCVLFFAAGQASVFESTPLGERDGLKVVSFDTVRQAGSTSAQYKNRRRQSDHDIIPVDVTNGLEMMNPMAQYFVNLSIGTPPQVVLVQLDTGSNDLVLNTPNSVFCMNPDNGCENATFSANASSTYRYLSSNASLGYGGGDSDTGDYVTDTIDFDGVTVNDVQMILSYDTTTADSIWGLSYSSGEQGIQYGESQYPSISELMVFKGAIQSNAYSLWLNSQGSSTGNLLFGGINKAKYSGPLYTIPIESTPNTGPPSQFIVTSTGIGLTLSDGSNISRPLIDHRADPYLIDSGTYNIEMPLDLMQPILAALGAEYEAASEYAMVPCSMTTNTSTLDFHFTSFAISIPLSELIFPQEFLAYSDLVPTLSDGKTPGCLLGIQPGGQDFILGDTFMRSAYIVFDLDNNEISMANANIGSDATQPDNIVEIGTGKNSVPGATKVVNPIRANQSESAIANDDVPATGTWSFYETVSTTFAPTIAPTVAGTTGIGGGGTTRQTGTGTATGSAATATASKAAAATSNHRGDFSKTCLVAILGVICLM